MNMNIQKITPLWETFPGREVQPEVNETERISFADIFQSLIDNVKEAEDEVAKKEYLLSTGQLDNPAELSMALYKAEASTQLMIQVREKMLNVYNELSRISL